MPRNGSGVYSPPAGTKGAAGATIESSKQNSWVDDVSSELSNSVAKDGQTPMTGTLQMGSNKISGLASAAFGSDAARYDQTVSGILTTRGDVVARGASGSQRLALGTNGAVLASDGTDVVWATNIAKKDVDNGFTANQTIEHTGAFVGWDARKTGGSVLAGYAQETEALFGTFSNHPVYFYTNSALRFALSVVGGLAAFGLNDPGVGAINSTGYFVNNTALPYQKRGVSTELTVVAGSSFVFAHGLGSAPKNVIAELVCKTTEYGYPVDAMVPITMSGGASGGAAFGLGLRYDANNIAYKIAASGVAQLVDQGTGSLVVPTAANWRLILSYDA